MKRKLQYDLFNDYFFVATVTFKPFAMFTHMNVDLALVINVWPLMCRIQRHR